ncbi:MAG: 50S ribosomal protein L10 [Candidatus Beckwithbacteria bacterium]|nr:50S ribosomal protein L10 [Patescibacteria group bacterium]
MPSQKNIQQVKLLIEKISKAKSIVLANCSGLNVNLQQLLRRKVKEAGGELIVAKNSLLNISLKQEKLDLPHDFKEILQGPTITLLSYQDEIAPIKALAEFAKNNGLPEIKAGFLNKDALTKEQVEALAKLPTKIELLALTVGTIKAPLTGFVNVLSGNLRNLVFALKAISAKGRSSSGRQTKKGGE